MALEIKLKYSINDAITQILVEDITGAYDLNNLTGWGTPNTQRNAVALVLYAKYLPYEQTAKNLSLLNALSPMVLYDNSYLNTEASTYSLSYHADGWYQFYLTAVPTSNVSPEENDIIYNTSSEELEIYKTDAFVALTSADWEYLIDEEKYELGFLEDILLPKLIVQRNCQLEKYINCMECTACKCETIKEDYIRLNSLIQAVDYRFHSDKQNEAQKMTEKLTKDYKCCK
jgi:hypothetical protein